jgi:hypothetical protein
LQQGLKARANYNNGVGVKMGGVLTRRAGHSVVCLLLIVGGFTVRLCWLSVDSPSAPVCLTTSFQFCAAPLAAKAAAVATSRMKRTLLVVHSLPLPERQRIIDVYRPHFSGLVYLQPKFGFEGSSSRGRLKMRNENEAIYECSNHLLSV